MISDPTCKAACEFIRHHLEADPAGTRQEYAEIQTELSKRGIVYEGKPLPICIAPALFHLAQIKPIQNQMRRLVRVLAKIEAPLRETAWLDRLGIHRSEQQLIQWPTRLKPGGYISRVDGFVEYQSDGSLGYQIVELNVDSPGGAAFMDESFRLVRRTSLWKQFVKKFPGRYMDTDSRDLPLLLKAWEDWGGKHKPRIAVIDWITVNTASEFELLKQRYNRLGYETIICDPRELEYRDGKLVDYDGQTIDLVYRRVLVEDLLAHAEAARPFLHAYMEEAVCVVNSFACKPLTVKSLLSWVHRSEFESLLNSSDLAFLRSLVPWTADVVDGPILERLRRDREQLILKPADGYGGQGLYLGWELDEQAWERGIEEALRERYVAQQRVHIPHSEFPVPQEQGWTFESFRMDFDPYMFGAAMADPLVRVAQSDILNVKAGAQIAATWVLDE
ncbi:hypothetical protein IV102_08195 [bacterium]|nr:hypothetical protein [bacterium]